MRSCLMTVRRKLVVRECARYWPVKCRRENNGVRKEGRVVSFTGAKNITFVIDFVPAERRQKRFWLLNVYYVIIWPYSKHMLGATPSAPYYSKHVNNVTVVT